MSILWMSIEPGYDETRLMLTCGQMGAALRARLPPVPRQPRALAMLLEAIVAWYGEPLTAVVDASDRAAGLHPARWAQLLDEIESEQVKVEWVVVPKSTERDRFLGELGDFGSAKRLLNFTATGQR
jgi:hypothetical protein